MDGTGTDVVVADVVGADVTGAAVEAAVDDEPHPLSNVATRIVVTNAIVVRDRGNARYVFTENLFFTEYFFGTEPRRSPRGVSTS